MATATLTSQGQLTPPKAIRDLLDLKPGDRVSFRVRKGQTVVVEPATADLRNLRGALKSRRRGVTVEEMDEPSAPQSQASPESVDDPPRHQCAGSFPRRGRRCPVGPRRSPHRARYQKRSQHRSEVVAKAALRPPVAKPISASKSTSSTC